MEEIQLVPHDPSWRRQFDVERKVLAEPEMPEERFAEVGQDVTTGAKSLLENLVTYTWHEAAHLGQLSGLRQEVGLPGTAELMRGG